MKALQLILITLILSIGQVTLNHAVEEFKLTASDAAEWDYFGWSVSISDECAIVGALANDDAGESSGSAYIFVRNGDTWTQQTKLTASDAAGGDRFGYSVSISDDYAIVGALGDDDTGSSSGSVYIFEVEVKPISATIDFDPDTLNLKNEGKWVTVYIELPGEDDVARINVTTVRLNDIILAVIDPKYGFVTVPDLYITDHNQNGIFERMVKFDRTAVADILKPGDEVTVTVTGKVEHDTSLVNFEGTDIIRVISKGKGRAAPVSPTQFTFGVPPPYPQPCNPEVWIPYTLGTDIKVTITIYSGTGGLVQTLDLGYQKAGTYTTKSKAAYWDGRCRNGEKVASGVYYYQLRAGEFRATRKMVIVK